MTDFKRIELAAFYLDWVNNFLTVDCMANHYGLTRLQTIEAIQLGRVFHNMNVREL